VAAPLGAPSRAEVCQLGLPGGSYQQVQGVALGKSWTTPGGRDAGCPDRPRRLLYLC
jgi:hypothetical protein